MSKFPIHKINFNINDLEQLGTKEKFWFLYVTDDSNKWLFKYSRENTGEHWSEKAAEQLCLTLDIPHARYELALSGNREGIITKNLISPESRMVMGNEVLHSNSPGVYPQPQIESVVRVREHTVSRVVGCLDGKSIAPPITEIDISDLNAADVFCGYLMLDTLISNQDRHHENWAIVVNNESNTSSLCPTYDHAASLGRELLDEERERRLTSKDKNQQITFFVSKARSELFRINADKKPLSTIDAFYNSVDGRKKAKDHWLSKLRNLTNENIFDIFNNIPNESITEISRKFAIQMVLENKKRLLEDERA